jgi:hypothetical protein
VLLYQLLLESPQVSSAVVVFAEQAYAGLLAEQVHEGSQLIARIAVVRRQTYPIT